jgi:hypothetical protein
LAALVGPTRKIAHFVANELIVSTDDSSSIINSLATRYDGEILGEIDPATAGLSDISKMYLLRVNVDKADLTNFAKDIEALAKQRGNRALEEWIISSEKGARLLALAASEKRAGHVVGVNFVGEGSSIPYSTQEAPTGPAGYTPDAYEWDYFTRGTEPGQISGVTQAWWILHRAGKLTNRVKIAILDGGFAPDDDFRDGLAFSVIPFVDPLNTENPSIGADWHGTWVGSAAMAIPDNMYGAAGSAGPVGMPVWVYTTGDMFFSIAALVNARIFGAKIVNMSYHIPVPWWLGWSVLPFEMVTWSWCDDGLCFASAGNDRKNVDSEICAWPFDWPCWEDTWWTPCENNGVICVGGLNSDGTWHGSSNYGHEHVDIYAPYCVWVGPDHDKSLNKAQQICGTSMASPFVAGVAALVWAANPGLSAGEVWRIIKDTAYRDHDRGIEQDILKVNAYDAVLQALGDWLSVDFWRPEDGAELPLNRAVDYMVNVHTISPEPGSVPVILCWESDRDGVFGNKVIYVSTRERAAVTSTLSEGVHKITTTATILRPFFSITAKDSLTVNIRNFPPSVGINRPVSGSEFCQGVSLAFHGIAEDPNERLLEDAFKWRSSRDGFLAEGSEFNTNSLSVGIHTVTLRVTDGDGLSAEDSVSVKIISETDPQCSGDLPPVAQILEPKDGTYFITYTSDDKGFYATVRLRGHASDREDEDSELIVEWLSDVEGVLGSGNSITVKLHAENVCDAYQPHTITLRVTDSSGNVSEDTITVIVQGPPC